MRKPDDFALLSLRPGHEEEDHDHIICNGRPVLIVEYGEVDADGNGVNCLGPRDVRRLVRSVNRAHAKRCRAERAARADAERLHDDALASQVRIASDAVRDHDAAITRAERAEAERDELRAALAGLREAATHLVQHIDEAFDGECPDRTCEMIEAADGGLDHEPDCLVATLTHALAAAPADLAAQVRAEVRRAALLEAAEAWERTFGGHATWLRALAAEGGPC